MKLLYEWVYKIQKEAEQGPLKTQARSGKRKHIQINCRDSKFSDFKWTGIRLKFHEFCFGNELPMLNSVLTVISCDCKRPHFKRLASEIILNAFCL
jgi:hypothetical protein